MDQISSSHTITIPPLQGHSVERSDSRAPSPPQGNSPTSSLPGLTPQSNPVHEASSPPRPRADSLPRQGDASPVAGTAGTSATAAPGSSPLPLLGDSQTRVERTATLERLQSEIAQASERAIQPEAAAELVNRLRRTGPGAHSGAGQPAATHADLMSTITEADVQTWYRAQGQSPEDIDALRKASLLSGLPNPAGTFLNNAMQYIASPWTSYAAGTPWAGAGVGFAAAAIAAPMNAGQQSAVVTLGESIREHGGPVIVPDKKSINDKHWLPELSKDLQHHVSQFSALHDQLHSTMSQLGIATVGYTEATLKPTLEGLASGDLQNLRQQVERLLNAEKTLHQTQRDFLMTQGAHDRQWQGNKWQAIPRTLRAPVAGLAGLVSKSGAAGWASPTVQTVASLVMTATQHVAAGFDERGKQEYNNKLNLLYGNFFTAGGNGKLTRGEPLDAGDIDAKKLRGFVQSPAQALVKHVSAELKKQVGALETLLTNASGGAASNPGVSGELPAGTAADREALAALKEDAGKLKEGKLSELRPGGLAEALLVASDKSVLSEQLWRDVVDKYTAREFSAQTAQRVGQMFHLGIFGSAASSVIGKVTSAATGGAKNAPIAQTVGVSMVSGAMAAVGALNQHTAISVKNNRCEGDTDIGLGKQVLRGMMGGASEWQAQREGVHASRAMNELLGQEPVDHMLQFAKAVRQQFGEVALPETTQVELTLAEAGQHLHMGHVSPAATGQVAIQIDPVAPQSVELVESSSAAGERSAREHVTPASGKGKEPMDDVDKPA